jgi:cysteine desulfurase family protein (TIGR01976 family)
MAFDVASVRGLFPALGDGWVHLDASEGMQVPEQVAAAVSTAMRAPVSGRGGVFPASQRAEAIVDAARRAIADLVGGQPTGVVLGPSAAVLLARLADALGESWLIGDEVVVSRLDQQANITPWLRAARRSGATTRWAEVDIETCELPAWQYEELINKRTKVVAVTAGSGVVGVRPELGPIMEQASNHGTLCVVDASAAAPFLPLDIGTLGADVVVMNASAWGGPPVAAMVFRQPTLLDRLPSLSLEPHARGADRLELGPHPYPLLAGLVASIEYLAGLDDTATGSRRERALTSMSSVRAYLTGLLVNLTTELRSQPHVMVIGDAMRRVPTVAFTVSQMKAPDVVERLAAMGVCAFADPGLHGVLAALGIGEIGGAVIAGLAHYTTTVEINRLIRAVATLA